MAERAEKAQLEATPPAGPDPATDHADRRATLEQLPDLRQALRDAGLETKRMVFDAFDLQIVYDKIESRVEISASITETVANMLQNAKDLPEEVLSVAQRDIAGAGFEPATFGL